MAFNKQDGLSINSTPHLLIANGEHSIAVGGNVYGNIDNSTHFHLDSSTVRTQRLYYKCQLSMISKSKGLFPDEYYVSLAEAGQFDNVIKVLKHNKSGYNYAEALSKVATIVVKQDSDKAFNIAEELVEDELERMKATLDENGTCGLNHTIIANCAEVYMAAGRFKNAEKLSERLLLLLQESNEYPTNIRIETLMTINSFNKNLARHIAEQFSEENNLKGKALLILLLTNSNNLPFTWEYVDGEMGLSRADINGIKETIKLSSIVRVFLLYSFQKRDELIEILIHDSGLSAEVLNANQIITALESFINSFGVEVNAELRNTVSNCAHPDRPLGDQYWEHIIELIALLVNDFQDKEQTISLLRHAIDFCDNSSRGTYLSRGKMSSFSKIMKYNLAKIDNFEHIYEILDIGDANNHDIYLRVINHLISKNLIEVARTMAEKLHGVIEQTGNRSASVYSDLIGAFYLLNNNNLTSTIKMVNPLMGLSDKRYYYYKILLSCIKCDKESDINAVRKLYKEAMFEEMGIYTKGIFYGLLSVNDEKYLDWFLSAETVSDNKVFELLAVIKHYFVLNKVQKIIKYSRQLLEILNIQSDKQCFSLKVSFLIEQVKTFLTEKRFKETVIVLSLICEDVFCHFWGEKRFEERDLTKGVYLLCKLNCMSYINEYFKDTCCDNLDSNLRCSYDGIWGMKLMEIRESANHMWISRYYWEDNEKSKAIEEIDKAVKKFLDGAKKLPFEGLFNFLIYDMIILLINFQQYESAKVLIKQMLSTLESLDFTQICDCNHKENGSLYFRSARGNNTFAKRFKELSEISSNDFNAVESINLLRVIETYIVCLTNCVYYLVKDEIGFRSSKDTLCALLNDVLADFQAKGFRDIYIKYNNWIIENNQLPLLCDDFIGKAESTFSAFAMASNVGLSANQISLFESMFAHNLSGSMIHNCVLHDFHMISLSDSTKEKVQEWLEKELKKSNWSHYAEFVAHLDKSTYLRLVGEYVDSANASSL